MPITFSTQEEKDTAVLVSAAARTAAFTAFHESDEYNGAYGPLFTAYHEARLAHEALWATPVAPATPVATEDDDDACDPEECVDCHCAIDDPADVQDGPDGALCESCYESYHPCYECDNLFHGDDLNTARDSDGDPIEVCDDCRRRRYSDCGDCGATVRDSGMEHVAGGGNVCRNCYEEHYFTCERCDNVRPNDEFHSCGQCDSCHSEDGPIQDAEVNAADSLGFFGEPADGLWLGLELEMQSTASESERGDVAQQVIDAIGDDFVIAKEDGSLRNGFEVNTAPADLQTHRERWKRFGESRPRQIRSWDATSCECGLHVHVSRAPLSALTVGKVAAFVNADENRTFVVKVAGRNSAWARLERKKVSNYHPRTIRNEAAKYSAVNVANPQTIEFRIFKGSLRVETILANAEFCHATVKFCEQASIRGLTATAFLAFVASHPKRYPFLASRLAEWGLIPAVGKSALKPELAEV